MSDPVREAMAEALWWELEVDGLTVHGYSWDGLQRSQKRKWLAAVDRALAAKAKAEAEADLSTSPSPRTAG